MRLLLSLQQQKRQNMEGRLMRQKWKHYVHVHNPCFCWVFVVLVCYGLLMILCCCVDLFVQYIFFSFSRPSILHTHLFTCLSPTNLASPQQEWLSLCLQTQLSVWQERSWRNDSYISTKDSCNSCTDRHAVEKESKSRTWIKLSVYITWNN